MISFVDTAVQVRTPATSANLGPGYDALGLALQLYDDVSAQVVEGGLTVTVAGEGETLPRDERHLVVRAMRATFDRIGAQPPGLVLRCTNRIPHGRGLGSSAAAIVSGIVLARGLARDGDGRLPDEQAFALAVELEGHPDNVAACYYGGLTIAWSDSTGARAVRADVSPALRPVALIPPFESSTAEARALLPVSVPHADAAFGSGRSALLVAVLTGAVPDGDALLAATDDRLHQAYRAPAMPQTAELVRILRAAGTAAVVSGAGPTVLAMARDDVEVEHIQAIAPPDWRCLPLAVDPGGARLGP